MRARTHETKTRNATGMLFTWAMGFGMGLAVLAFADGARDEQLPASASSSRSTAPMLPETAIAAATVEPGACREDVAAWDAALEGLTANLKLAAQVAQLESALAALRAGAIDGPSFVRTAVHAMPENEIKGILAATAKLDPARLDAIDDIQGYAVRLADIAMEGVLADDSDPIDVGEVVFSARQDGRRTDWQTTDAFDRGEDRLYAFFDTTEWPNGEVMVRWRHVDSGDVLLLEQHRVRAGSERGFVWARPSRGWQAGAYRVDVYSGDESLGLLASGRYVVN